MLRPPIRHERVGVPMPHLMIGFQPVDHFHVFQRFDAIQQREPMLDRLPVFLFDGRKIGSGAFYFFFRHGELLYAYKNIRNLTLVADIR